MIWSDIPGWTCPQLLRLYAEVCIEKTSGVFVEVGVAYGRSLAYLASHAAPEVQILGVDSWLVKMGRNNGDVWDKVKGSPTAFEAADHMINSAVPPPRRIELCRGNSPDVARALDFEVDFVFLDGSHEYDSVRADIFAWWPRVKPGGILAGHDINDHYPGVERAVDDCLRAHNPEKRKPTADSDGWGGVWIVRRPR